MVKVLKKELSLVKFVHSVVFGRNSGNVAAGLVSALLFATLLVVIAFLVLNDVSRFKSAITFAKK